MNENEFATGSVPVMVAARIYGKDASWVRAGIISGWLPIGKATRNGQLVTKIEDMNSKYGRINFYISPKRLYEETGYVWKGEKDRYFRVGIAAAELLIPLMCYGIWMNKGFKFEETGTFTSSTFKGLINRFRPTKK